MTATTDLSSPDATRAFLESLRAALPASAFREVAPHYLEEPRGRFPGHAAAVLAPGSVEDVSVIVRAAAAHRVPVVPYGGGTGLVSGQTVPEGPVPVLLSLERMARIRSVNAREAVMVAEAGAVLQDVQAAAEAAGLLFPLSLGAEGSCRIGGNLATNAGGVNVLRYGNARALCLGLEAVLPSGEIWHGLKRLRKDNTGYDLRDLLIGSEGTLGVITAAALRLFPRPRAEAAAFMTVAGPEAALDLLSLAQTEVGEGVSAFELISRQGLEFMSEKLPQIRQPFDALPDWMVLIDLGLSGSATPQDALAAIFETALERGLVSEGVISASEAQRQEFWLLRESIPLANKAVGSVASHDVSLPLESLADFIVSAQEKVAEFGPYRVNVFGHVGDGNLHFNVFPPAGEPRAPHLRRSAEIQRAVHDLVAEMHGSFSAEHGVGRLKVEDLERYGDPAELAAMRAIKTALDPLNIMNPGAVLRA